MHNKARQLLIQAREQENPDAACSILEDAVAEAGKLGDNVALGESLHSHLDVRGKIIDFSLDFLDFLLDFINSP